MNNQEKKQFIEQEFTKINIKLTSEQSEQFLKYADLLTEWNKVMNLTAITDFEEIVKKHFVDSCCLAMYEDLSSDIYAKKIVDIGTGAGFPGIPLKICYPKIQMTLIDSLGKRIKFLNTVISELNLENIEAYHGRAEDEAQKPVFRQQFDYCVSRAVANLSVLAEYCLPFIKKGGIFCCYKSADVKEESAKAEKAIAVLGGKTAEIRYFSLPETDIKRALLIIKKIKYTPDKYPRKAGLPTQKPLS